MELREYTFEELWPGRVFHINGIFELTSTDKEVTVVVEHWDGPTPVLRSGLRGVLLGEAQQVFPVKLPTATLHKPKSVWDTQVGGSHYTSMKIQPFQFSMANKLDPMQHTIVKYVTRFRAKNGIQDLEKAKQTIDLLIQWEKDNATDLQK